MKKTLVMWSLVPQIICLVSLGIITMTFLKEATPLEGNMWDMHEHHSHAVKSTLGHISIKAGDEIFSCSPIFWRVMHKGIQVDTAV